MPALPVSPSARRLRAASRAILCAALAACSGEDPGDALGITAVVEPMRVEGAVDVLARIEPRATPGHVDFAADASALRLFGIQGEGGAWTAAPADDGAYAVALDVPIWEDGAHALFVRGLAPEGAALEVRCDGEVVGSVDARALAGAHGARLDLDPGRVRPPSARVEIRSSTALAGPLGPDAAVRLADLALTPVSALERGAVKTDAPEGARVLEPGRAYALELDETASDLVLEARGETPSELEVRVFDDGPEPVAIARFAVEREATVHAVDLSEAGPAVARIYVPSDAEPVTLLEASARRPSRPPNVILIVVDTLRADAAFEPDGEGLYPSLRALGEDGVVFTQCYSHAPMTLSSHVALFSSRPPFESRVLKNGDRIPLELPLLAETLRDAGFATASAVSIGALNPEFGPTGVLDGGIARGFDSHLVEGWGVAWAEAVLPRHVEALDAIGAARPLFLFAHYCDPHEPYRGHGEQEEEVELTIDGERIATLSATMAEAWTATLPLAPGPHALELSSGARFSVRSLRAKIGPKELALDLEGETARHVEHAAYAFEVPGDRPADVLLRAWVNDVPGKELAIERYHGEVAYVDAYLGRLIQELKARDLYEDSLIVFTSDHGEGLGDHDWMVHAENVYDEQLHVPLVIKLPRGAGGVEALRSRRHALVRHVDLVPTILEALGLPPMPGQRGLSLFRRGERVLIASTAKPIAKRDLVCLRDERFKMIYDAGAGTFEMYDVVADPGEEVDVFERSSSERAEWVQDLPKIGGILLKLNAGGLDAIDADTRAELGALGYLDR